jgi:PAS domain S-box-containing protein
MSCLLLDIYKVVDLSLYLLYSIPIAISISKKFKRTFLLYGISCCLIIGVWFFQEQTVGDLSHLSQRIYGILGIGFFILLFYFLFRLISKNEDDQTINTNQSFWMYKVMIVFFLISTSVIGYIYNTLSNVNLHTFIDSQKNNLTKIKCLTESSFYELRTEIKLISNIHSVQNFKTNPSNEALRVDLLALMKSNDDFKKIYLLDKSGIEEITISRETHDSKKLIFDTSSKNKKNELVIHRLKEFELGEVYLSPIHPKTKELSARNTLFKVATPIENKYHEKVGVIVIDFFADGLDVLLNDKEFNSRGKDIHVIDYKHTDSIHKNFIALTYFSTSNSKGLLSKNMNGEFTKTDQNEFGRSSQNSEALIVQKIELDDFIEEKGANLDQSKGINNSPEIFLLLNISSSSLNNIITSELPLFFIIYCIFSILFILISYYTLFKQNEINKSNFEIHKLNGALNSKIELGTLELSQTKVELEQQLNLLDKSAIISITDVHGNLIRVNDTFCEISGYSSSELLGQNHRILKSGKHPEELFTVMWAAISKGLTWKGEICNKRKDGSFYWVSTFISPIFDADGNIIKYVSVRFDITERKKQEQERFNLQQDFSRELENKVVERTIELEDARKELVKSLEKEKELSILKSRFVATASHQFRTPLSVIQSNMGILSMQKDGMKDTFIPKFEKAYRNIKSQIEVMTNLMNEVLILGKINSGNIRIQIEPLDILPLCMGVVKNYTEMDGGKIINVDTKGTPYLVNLDATLFEHALSNIISNAIKYSPDDKQIDLTVRYSSDHLELRVKDYGIGIPEDSLKFIFQPFYRALNVKQISGTGLGTAIAKEYIELMGGTIDFQSEINKGTEFIIKLKK